ncbi:MAG: hypothetical protein QM734_16045 [Cyclobacteriaceae bacterium]
MEELNRFEQLLKQKSFKSLNEEERNFVFQFIGSEDEYESLRNTENELQAFFDREQKLQPRNETLRKIKQSRAIILPQNFWIRPSVPTYVVALLLIIGGAIGWWSGAQFGSEKIIVEKIVSHTDTLRIVSAPDTIVRERIIYLPSRKMILAGQPETKEAVTTKGVNMKDKEELERLLVSGTY